MLLPHDLMILYMNAVITLEIFCSCISILCGQHIQNHRGCCFWIICHSCK